MSKHLYSNYRYIWSQCHNTMDSLFTYIQGYPSIEMDSYGNITVKNTTEKKPLPVFCCHLDTVHADNPAPTLIKDDVLISFNGHGIGGDDKCGIIACLELLSRVECKCIFFRDEESGCLGSSEYDTKSLKNDLFCIEIDRRNATDLIIKSGGADMCGKEFLNRVKAALPHCKVADGAFTDVSRLGDANINMLNISSGYYQPHTDKEYVVLSELQTNIDGLAILAKDVVQNPMSTTEFERTGGYNYGNSTKSKGLGNWKTTTVLPGFEQTAGADDYEQLQYGEYHYGPSRRKQQEDDEKEMQAYWESIGYDPDK